MTNKKFCRLKKTIAFLLMVLFILSVTAASASATCTNGGMNGNGDGYNKGFEDGKMQAKIDCEKYGSKDVLSKIPSPPDQQGCTEYYKDNYKNGYEKGYVVGYNQIRYDCLK
jgi:hypothetical protein